MTAAVPMAMLHRALAVITYMAQYSANTHNDDNSRLSTDGTKSRSTQITCDSNTAATDASTAAAGYIAYAAFFESLTETSPAAIKSSATRSLTAI